MMVNKNVFRTHQNHSTGHVTDKIEKVTILQSWCYAQNTLLTQLNVEVDTHRNKQLQTFFMTFNLK